MSSLASSTADINTLFSNAGATIAVTVTAVLLGAIALVGLGFAWRHLTKRITGKKF